MELEVGAIRLTIFWLLRILNTEKHLINFLNRTKRSEVVFSDICRLFQRCRGKIKRTSGSAKGTECPLIIEVENRKCDIM